MKTVALVWPEGDRPLAGGVSPFLALSELAPEEQFVIWALRNWFATISCWPRFVAGFKGYFGDADCPDALRAFGDLVLCLQHKARRGFRIGEPGRPLTADETAVLALVAAQQEENDPQAERLAVWLVRPDSHHALTTSSRRFSAAMMVHGLFMPNRAQRLRTDASGRL